MVVDFSDNPVSHAKQVLRMVEQMEELLEYTLSQENQIVEELQYADVTVIPSFVETYCLAFAESMLIGTPTVVSYTGAMPELADHGEECLFYNSMDFLSCAYYVDQLVRNKALAEKLSANGRKRRLQENDRELVVNTQLDIYHKIIES